MWWDSHSIGSGNFCYRQYLYPSARQRESGHASQLSKRSQHLNFWMQVYNLSINEATKSNEAVVHYQIIEPLSNAVVFDKQLD